MTSSKSLPKAPSPNNITLGARASAYEFLRDKQSVQSSGKENKKNKNTTEKMDKGCACLNLREENTNGSHT